MDAIYTSDRIYRRAELIESNLWRTLGRQPTADEVVTALDEEDAPLRVDRVTSGS